MNIAILLAVISTPYQIHLDGFDKFDKSRLPIIVNGNDAQDQDRLGLLAAVAYWHRAMGGVPVRYGDPETPGMFVAILYNENPPNLAKATVRQSSATIECSVIHMEAFVRKFGYFDRLEIRRNLFAHEIGHVLGLGHSPDRGNLMFPYVGLNRDSLDARQLEWLGVE